MKAKWFRFFAIITIIVVIAGSALVYGRENEREEASDGEMPTALAKHLEQLQKSIPGAGGESGEGPGSLPR